MRGNLFCTLSLSALLLACAHDKGNRSTQQHRAEAQAEAEDAPRQAAAEHDHDGVDSDGDGRDADRVALPERSEQQRERMATAGDELPRADKPQRARAAETPQETTELNPMDQGSSEIDIDLTQRIRKALMDDDTLSFKAKNVKVITRDGHVTLRGSVKTPEEKSAIGKTAIAAAGAAHVTNQLEVGE